MIGEVALGLEASTLTDWSEIRHSPILLGTIFLAGVGTTVLFTLGAIAYSQRRSVPYLLITLALGALVVRTIVGFGTALGYVPMGIHHLVEHGLDFLIASLLLAAIYRSGSTSWEERRIDDTG